MDSRESDNDMELESEPEEAPTKQPEKAPAMQPEIINSNKYGDGSDEGSFIVELCKSLPAEAATKLFLEPENCPSSKLRPFSKGDGDLVEIKDDVAVARLPVSKGQLVGEYCGEVVAKTEAAVRLREYGKTGQTPRMVLLSRGRVVDATAQGSVLALHAQHVMEDPNTVLQRWVVQGKPRIGLFAQRDMAAGEVITYNKNETFLGAIDHSDIDFVEVMIGSLSQGKGRKGDEVIGPMLRLLAEADNAQDAILTMKNLKDLTDSGLGDNLWSLGGALVLGFVLNARGHDVLVMALEWIQQLPSPNQTKPGATLLQKQIEYLTRHSEPLITDHAERAKAQLLKTNRKRGQSKWDNRPASPGYTASQGQQAQPRPSNVTQTANGIAADQPQSRSTAVDDGLPPNWKTAKDARGRVYYYHTTTRKTQWDRPGKHVDDPEPKRVKTELPVEPTASNGHDRQPASQDHYIVIGQQRIAIPPPVQAKATVSATANEKQPLATQNLSSAQPMAAPALVPQSDTRSHVQHVEPAMANATPAPHQHVTQSTNSVHKDQADDSNALWEVAKATGPPSALHKPEDTSHSLSEEEVETTSRSTSTAMQVASTEQRSTSDKDKADFREKLSKIVVKALAPYRKESCTIGRITSKDDFKHCARKITHVIMAKHEREGRKFIMDDRTAGKAREAVPKYMERCGPVYRASKKGS